MRAKKAPVGVGREYSLVSYVACLKYSPINQHRGATAIPKVFLGISLRLPKKPPQCSGWPGLGLLICDTPSAALHRDLEPFSGGCSGRYRCCFRPEKRPLPATPFAPIPACPGLWPWGSRRSSQTRWFSRIKSDNTMGGAHRPHLSDGKKSCENWLVPFSGVCGDFLAWRVASATPQGLGVVRSAIGTRWRV